MFFSLAAPLCGSLFLLSAWYSDSPSRASNAPEWITALATVALALIGFIAVLEYRKRRKQDELYRLDAKVLWWFILQHATNAISAPDLAAKLGHTLGEITDSVMRLSRDGKLITTDGEHWQLNRAMLLGKRGVIS